MWYFIIIVVTIIITINSSLRSFFPEPSNPVLTHFQWDFFFQWGADFSEFKINQLLLNSLSIIQARNSSREVAPFFFFEATEVLSRCSHLLPHVLSPALHLNRFLQINDSWSINDPKSHEFKSYRIDFNLVFHQTNQNDNSRKGELFWRSSGKEQCLAVLSKWKSCSKPKAKQSKD